MTQTDNTTPQREQTATPAVITGDAQAQAGAALGAIRAGWRQKASAQLSNVPGPLFGLIAIVIVLSILSPYFLTVTNLLNILSQMSSIGIMAVGAVLVIIIGGIDLSVGSVVALTSISTGFLYQTAKLPFVFALVIGLALGALVGLINGILTTFGKLQAFIGTLATMSAAAGLALYITGGNPINGFPEWFQSVTSATVFGLPLQGLILVAVFVLASFWLRFRPSGRALYAIGGNEEVARLSGLPIRRIKITVYVIAGFLAAFAGALITSRLDSAQPTAGTADLLSVIAVVVIGGASLAGGSGSMLGTFVGLLVIGVLNNGLSLLNVNPNLQPVVLGAVIVAAVMTDRRARKRQH